MIAARDIRRILVAMDTSAPSQAALEAAAALAERLNAELHGIYVQDQELLRLAQLPVGREVGLASARRRDLNPQGMERAWRVQAAHAKTALELVAKRHHLQSSFRIARGNVVAELLRASLEADMLAMGTLGHMAITGRRIGSTVRGVTTQASCSVLLLHPAARTGTTVFVAYGGSEAADRALGWAEQLAKARNSDLVVLIARQDDNSAALRDRAEGQLSELTERAQIQEIPQSEFRNVLEGSECALLIIPHDSELLQDGDELLSQLRTPVLVAR